MTIDREPGTFEYAIYEQIAEPLGGLKVIAAELGVSDSTVTKWSNPNERALPNVEQAVALDTLYRKRFGVGAPMQDCHEERLDRAFAETAGCRRLLAALLTELITEHADALAAIIPLMQPDVKLHQIRRARREIGQAQGVFGQVARVVDQFLSTGGQVPGGTQP